MRCLSNSISPSKNRCNMCIWVIKIQSYRKATSLLILDNLLRYSRGSLWWSTSYGMSWWLSPTFQMNCRDILSATIATDHLLKRIETIAYHWRTLQNIAASGILYDFQRRKRSRLLTIESKPCINSSRSRTDEFYTFDYVHSFVGSSSVQKIPSAKPNPSLLLETFLALIVQFQMHYFEKLILPIHADPSKLLPMNCPISYFSSLAKRASNSFCFFSISLLPLRSSSKM